MLAAAPLVAAPFPALLPVVAGRCGRRTRGGGGAISLERLTSAGSSFSASQCVTSPLSFLVMGAFLAVGRRAGCVMNPEASWRTWRRQRGFVRRITLGTARRQHLGDDEITVEADGTQAAEKATHIEQKRLGWLRRTLKRLAGSNLEADLEARLLKAQALSATLEASLLNKDKALSEVSGKLEAAQDRGSKEKELREALEAEVRAISKAAELNEARLRRDLAEEEKKAKALKSAYEELSDALEGSQTEVESELHRLREQLADANRRAEAAAIEMEASHQEKEALRRELEQERTRSETLEADRARSAQDVARTKIENLRLQSELDTSQETLGAIIKRLEDWKIRNSALLRPPAK